MIDIILFMLVLVMTLLVPVMVASVLLIIFDCILFRGLKGKEKCEKT